MINSVAKYGTLVEDKILFFYLKLCIFLHILLKNMEMWKNRIVSHKSKVRSVESLMFADCYDGAELYPQVC